jgi:hypothetical protein
MHRPRLPRLRLRSRRTRSRLVWTLPPAPASWNGSRPVAGARPALSGRVPRAAAESEAGAGGESESRSGGRPVCSAAKLEAAKRNASKGLAALCASALAPGRASEARAHGSGSALGSGSGTGSSVGGHEEIGGNDRAKQKQGRGPRARDLVRVREGVALLATQAVPLVHFVSKFWGLVTCY